MKGIHLAQTDIGAIRIAEIRIPEDICTCNLCEDSGGEGIPQISDALLMEDGTPFLMEDGIYFQLEGEQPQGINRSYWKF